MPTAGIPGQLKGSWSSWPIGTRGRSAPGSAKVTSALAGPFPSIASGYPPISISLPHPSNTMHLKPVTEPNY